MQSKDDYVTTTCALIFFDEQSATMNTNHTPHRLGFVDMTNAEYQASPGTSKGQLDKIASCPMDYWHHYLNPNREPEAAKTPALILGDACHDAILQPDLFASKWVKMPGFNNRSKAGREERDAWLAERPGASVLDDEDYTTALAVRDAVHRHPIASRLVTGGAAEQSWFAIDPEANELIRCRTDYLIETAGMITDLKTTDDASPEGFARSVAKFRYFVQQPWYQDVFKALYGEAPPFWVFLAVEKSPPYKIGTYFLEPEDVARGRAVARRNFSTLLECRRTNRWPDYSVDVAPLSLPGWFRRTID